MRCSIYMTWRIDKYIHFDIIPVGKPKTVVFVTKTSDLSNNILDIFRRKDNNKIR